MASAPSIHGKSTAASLPNDDLESSQGEVQASRLSHPLLEKELCNECASRSRRFRRTRVGLDSPCPLRVRPKLLERRAECSGSCAGIRWPRCRWPIRMGPELRRLGAGLWWTSNCAATLLEWCSPGGRPVVSCWRGRLNKSAPWVAARLVACIVA